MKLHTLFSVSSVTNSKAQEYVIVFMHNDEQVCFGYVVESEIANKVNFAIDAICNIEKLDKKTIMEISDIIDNAISLASGLNNLSWALKTNNRIWMNKNDFLRNYSEVTEEDKLPSVYKEFLKQLRS